MRRKTEAGSQVQGRFKAATEGFTLAEKVRSVIGDNPKKKRKYKPLDETLKDAGY